MAPDPSAERGADGGVDLHSAAFSGMRWATIAKLAGEVLAVSGSVALARLIGPADFGRAAVAQMLMPLAVILSFEGFASALVQRRTLDVAAREMATFLSIAMGVALTAIVWLAGRTVAVRVFGHETAGMIALVSPVFVIAAVGAVPRALLWRSLDFRWASVAEVLGLLAGTSVSVVLAAAGVDGHALIWGTLAMVTTTTVVLVAVADRTLPRWHRREWRSIGRFGAPAAAAGLVGIGFQNIDYGMVAARLSATQAGIYWRAFQLGVVYQDKVSGIMLRIAFPLYSRSEGLDGLRRLHERATRLHAAVVFPFLATFIVIAPEFVDLVFGPAWSEAAGPSRILAVAGMCAAVLTGYPQVMLAAGRPGTLLRFNSVFLVLYGVVVWFAIPSGIVAVAVGVTATYVVMVVAAYAALLRPVLGIPVARLATDVLPPLAGCAMAIVGGIALQETVDAAGAGDLLTVAAVAPWCLGLYALVLRVGFPELWYEIDTIVRGVLPDRRRTTVTPPPLPADALIPEGS